MVVITRYTVPEGEDDDFLADAEAAVQAMAERPGFRGSRIARAADDPRLWTVVTEWEGPGAYRRALSNYDVRVGAMPLLTRAHNEPSAFEVVSSRDAAYDGAAEPRQGTNSPG